MPYIKKETRKLYDKFIDGLVDALTQEEPNAGHANYVITRLLLGMFDVDIYTRYHKINTITGILECVKLELSRRITAKFESVKSDENGDVYEYQRFDKGTIGQASDAIEALRMQELQSIQTWHDSESP